MPSVTRDKRKYGAPTVGGKTRANAEREQKEREAVRGDELRRDHAQRRDGDEYYHTGRVRPLISDDE